LSIRNRKYTMTQLEQRPTARPQVAVDVSCQDLHRALGAPGSPATVTFAIDALTVTTPAGTVRIRARTVVASGQGARTAGLRPSDADMLREATDDPYMVVNLAAGVRTLTLTGPGKQVTVGRW
jgi:hypothetical protein